MGDIDFKVIFVVENSNKFQKTRFWKEKLVENVVITFECLIFNSSKYFPFIFDSLKMGYISILCKIMSYEVVFTLHYYEFTLGPMAQATLA